MNDFEVALRNLNVESEKIKKMEVELRMAQQLFNEKFFGFLKENGMPENFSLSELAMFAIRKAKSTIIAP
jgi:hypothetical protein